MRHAVASAIGAAVVLLLATLVPAWAEDPVPSSLASPQIAQACCKHCTKGKPCGDSCIARDRTCEKGPGCACRGDGGLSEDLDRLMGLSLPPRQTAPSR